MDFGSIFLGLVLGFSAGFFVSFFVWGRESTKQKIEKAQLETALAKEKEIYRQLIENKKALEDAFKSLASDALNQNSKNFVALATESIKAIEAETKGVLGEKSSEISSKINDLKSALEEFDKNVKEIEIKRETAYNLLETGQKRLDKTTDELLKALKFAKGVGNWGEIQLKRIVELSGMVEHCDFNVQVPTTVEGKLFLLDMVVHLPQNRKIIIDAKTPLSAFLKSLEEGEEKREELINEFIKNINDKVKELSKKEYHKKIEGSIEFVVMFIPSEAMFSTIMEKDSSFVEKCLKSNIIPTSPLNLIAVLKSVAYGWRQSELEVEAKRILEKAKEIYEALCKSSQHLSDLGKSLHKAVESYNTYIGSVERNVFSKGREIAKLSPDRTIQELSETTSIPRELKSSDWKNEEEK